MHSVLMSYRTTVSAYVTYAHRDWLNFPVLFDLSKLSLKQKSFDQITYHDFQAKKSSEYF